MKNFFTHVRDWFMLNKMVIDQCLHESHDKKERKRVARLNNIGLYLHRVVFYAALITCAMYLIGLGFLANILAIILLAFMAFPWLMLAILWIIVAAYVTYLMLYWHCDDDNWEELVDKVKKDIKSM